MYLRHFAFTRWPFAANLESDQLFASASRQEAEARLQHLLHLRGIGLLTGEVGCGKTTVCRAVTASLHPGLFRVLYVSLTTVFSDNQDENAATIKMRMQRQSR